MRALSTALAAALLMAAASSAAAAVVTTAPKAAAAPGAKVDPVTADVRCLLTMAVLGQDKTRQQAALIGAYFFAGRLSARAPGLDVPAAIKAQEAKMSPKDLPAEAQRCGPLVQASMGALQKSFSPPAGARPAPGAAPAPSTAPPTTTPATPPTK